MYTPSLTETQIQQLYKLRRIRRRPMSKILREIVDEYVEKHAEELAQYEIITTQLTRLKKVG